ncbi:MAG: DNA-methyltransferase [Thermoguttaceae bacterium]
MNKAVFRDGVVYNADCLEVLPTIEPVDLVVSDPPYGCAYKTNHRKKSTTPAMLANDEKPNLAFIAPIVKAVKPDSAIYLCTRFDVYAQWEQALKEASTVVKTTIVWNKGNWTAGDLKGDYGNQVELILFAHVGRPKLRRGRPSNLWSIPRDPPGAHPTPKPVELFKRCILNSSDIGDVVLDPFLGSGTTAVACILSGRRFISCELDRRYFDLSCKRIEKTYREIDSRLPGFEPDTLEQ